MKIKPFCLNRFLCHVFLFFSSQAVNERCCYLFGTDRKPSVVIVICTKKETMLKLLIDQSWLVWWINNVFLLITLNKSHSVTIRRVAFSCPRPSRAHHEVVHCRPSPGVISGIVVSIVASHHLLLLAWYFLFLGPFSLNPRDGCAWKCQ